MGIFVVWFPAVMVAQRQVGNLKRKDFWKVVLKGSPDWVRYLVYCFLGYPVVNFMYFFIQAPTGRDEGATLRLWSGADFRATGWFFISRHLPFCIQPHAKMPTDCDVSTGITFNPLRTFAHVVVSPRCTAE
jgi:hypothetical protein